MAADLLVPSCAPSATRTRDFHDLRHTGNLLSAGASANLRELVERMGHSTTRAAMIYMHTTSERQRKIADGIDDLSRAELTRTRK